MVVPITGAPTVTPSTTSVWPGGHARRLGAVLAVRRSRLGLTQTEVARRMGFAAPNIISMIESGRTKVPVERAVEFAKLYGLDPWKVLRRALVELRPDIETHLPV